MATRRVVIKIETVGAEKAAADIQKVNQGVTGMMSQYGNLTTTLFKGILAFKAASLAINAFTGSLKFGIQQAADFELSMAKLSAITGTPKAQLEGLETVIRELGATSPKTAAEVADAALAMSKLGLSAKDTAGILPSVIGMSVALDESVEGVGETLVGVKNAYGLFASELQATSNQLFTGFARSALNLEKFRTSFGYVGGTAKQAGVEFHNLVAAMGTLSNAAIRPSTIGTQLRRIFLNLSDSTTQASKAIGGATIASDGLYGVLEKLAPVISKAGESKRLFGLTAASVINILVKNREQYRLLGEEIKNTDDKIGAAAETIQDTMLKAWVEVTSAWTEANIVLSKLYGPAVISGLNVLAAAIRNVSTASKEIQNLGGGGLASAEMVKSIEDAQLRNSELSDALKRTMAMQEDYADMQDDSEEAYNNSQKAAEAAAQEAEKAIAQQKTAHEEAIKLLNSQIDQTKLLFEISKMTGEEDIGRYQNELTLLYLRSKALNDYRSQLELLKEIQSIASPVIEEGLTKEDISASNARFDEFLRGKKERIKTIEQEEAANQKLKEAQSETSREYIKWLENKTQAEKIYKDFTKESVNAFADSVATSIVEMQSFGEAMKNLFQSLIKDLIALTIKFIIFRSILAGVKAITGGGIAPVPGIGATDIPSAIIGAKGYNGVVNKPTMFLAGESGAERVTIKPRADQTQSFNGLSINIQGDVYGKDKFMEGVNEALERIERRYVNV